MENQSANNKRIAKNTLMLYVRMLLIMAVALYTSRIVLQTLGVENFGIQNVVGGLVIMFSSLSGSFSSSISRFITFELGTNNIDRLKKIFSTGINIQLIIGILIVIIAEIVGMWFLNYKMKIPADRLIAANWVLQCSLISFFINLLSVPYNASIIAHEKMSAFAYISVIEVILKLLIVYLLFVSPIDKLISYSVLLVLVSLIIRLIYGVYCKKHFEECTYHLWLDKNLLKEMCSFAGWNFFGNTAYILNTQGINMLMNVFFGVTINAARGIAIQVDSAVRQFVGNFMTAVNPQITKKYAANELDAMHSLICRSSKFSAFLLLFFAVPIVLEANTILKIWLGNPPESSAMFSQLALFATFCDCVFANSLVTAIQATGNIKKYQIIITICGFLVFPLTWLAYTAGCKAEMAYFIYIVVYFSLIFVRLYLLKDAIKLRPMLYIRSVLFRTLPIIFLSFLLTYLIKLQFEESFLRLIITTISSFFFSSILIYSIGLTSNERLFVRNKASRILFLKK